MRDAQIEQMDAIQLIEKMNAAETLIYADPPYLNETVASTSYYKIGMSDDEHLELLNTLKLHKGPVILSGYNSTLYDVELKNWHKIEFEAITGNVGREKKVVTECLWTNFEPTGQIDIFEEALK